RFGTRGESAIAKRDENFQVVLIVGEHLLRQSVSLTKILSREAAEQLLFTVRSFGRQAQILFIFFVRGDPHFQIARVLVILARVLGHVLPGGLICRCGIWFTIVGEPLVGRDLEFVVRFLNGGRRPRLGA